MEDSPFKIIIATTPEGRGLTETVRRLKVALLLADKVETAGLEQALLFRSLATSAQLIQSQQQTLKEAVDRLIDIMRIMTAYSDSDDEEDQLPQDIVDMIKAYQSGLVVPLSFPITPKQRSDILELADAMKEDKGSYLDFFALVHKVLHIQYLKMIGKMIQAGESYPLLDRGIYDLAYTDELLTDHHGADAKQHPVLDSDRLAKPVAIASDLFQRIPLFEEVAIDELLDIRKELNAPLTRFRGALLKLSDEIALAPWDENFHKEVDYLLHKEIQPEISSIEEQVKGTPYLERLSRKVFDKPLELGGKTAVGLLLGHLTNFDQTWLAVLSGALAIGTTAYQTFDEQKEERKAISRNRFYFYYEVDRRLTK